jgi:anaerobic selenocysteine-containing dehydrogenase
MNRASTVVSYLHHLVVTLTGNFGKKGAHYVPTTLVPFASGASGKKSPVVGAPIISGLVPCNSIAEEILTDHPRRYRGMLVEAANPAHSLADSQRMREALKALDTLVVIDVAMSETAALADYVLPASSQFEKAEATFFNFEFPSNYFHLRHRLLEPPAGPLAEAEIHARLCEALGAVTEADYAPLREAMKRGLPAYTEALMNVAMSDPRLSGQAPVLLYRTLELGEGVREGAVLLGLALRFAMNGSASLARAGFGGTPVEAALALFTAIIESPSGLVFSIDTWDDMASRLGTPDGKIHVDLPDLLQAFRAHVEEPEPAHDLAFPFVLTAGERRSFTANTIIRDPSWRTKDAEGALRMNPGDAAMLGVGSGDAVRLSTKRGTVVVTVAVSDTMQPGHVSLPNGTGVDYPGASGANGGVAPNELTALEDRDPFAGTPWHKFVPARLDRVAGE